MQPYQDQQHPQTTRSMTGTKKSTLVGLIPPEVIHRRESSPSCSTTPCPDILPLLSLPSSSLTSEIAVAAATCTPDPPIVTSPTLRYHSFANAVAQVNLEKEEEEATGSRSQVFDLDHITSSFMSNSTLIPLSRPHRGSMSSPCVPTLSALNEQDQISTEQLIVDTIQVSRSPPPHSSGSRTSARTFISRAVGFGQLKAAAVQSGKRSHPPTCTTTTTTTTREMTGKASIASNVANEVLSLIFGQLMDRKSILNCSLVSTHWHGPARLELARIVQDMPFNGQGLVHAIRTRFATDTFPFVSMAQFDKLLCNLSEIYCHSNPETKEIFAPAYAPDVLYELFWTFLFIDQEFRNPRARPKVSCSFFVRLLQEEEAGYPRLYFDKKVLKNIYNDIKSKPLLPAPHFIRVCQGVDSTSSPNMLHERPSMRTLHSSFLGLANSMKLEEPFKRVRRWWKSAYEELGERNQMGRASPRMDMPDTHIFDEEQGAEWTFAWCPIPSTSTSSSTSNREDSQPLDSTAMGTPPSSMTSRQLPRSDSSTPPQGVPSVPRSFRSRFGGTNSDFELTSRAEHVPRLILTRGFTTIPHGWRPEGDGLDQLVCFPKSERPSTLGSQYLILQYSDLTQEVTDP